MAERGEPWHVCDDCLEPLARELFALANQFNVHFDVAKRDEVDSEHASIIEAAGYDTKRLTKAQQKRLNELSQEIKGQTEPPRPFDVESLYRQYNIDLATDWLKFNISVDYADDFKRTLADALKRFTTLDFKACQIINGDVGKESTIQVRYAIRRLIDRHYELLREQFPNHEAHPERDELPDDLRAVEVEILDEYTFVEQEIRKTAEYLGRTSILVRSKLAKAKTPTTIGLIERLLDGPEDAELTPTEFALLDAHLQQPISFAAIQQEKQATGKLETNAQRNKLKLIRDYNRNLQSASNSPTPAKAKRPGRKKADYKTQQREAQLAADWKRAYEAGTYKADFARDNKLTVSKLDALLDRVAKRKARSDN
jgi:hypothetical protein